MKCCACNNHGTSTNCVCVKSDTPCTNCTPGKKGSCVNRKPKDAAAANPTPTSGRQLVDRSDSQRAQELLHAAAKSAAPTLFSSGTASTSPSTSVAIPETTARDESEQISYVSSETPRSSLSPRTHLFCSPHRPPHRLHNMTETLPSPSPDFSTSSSMRPLERLF